MNKVERVRTKRAFVETDDCRWQIDENHGNETLFSHLFSILNARECHGEQAAT